MRELGSDRSCDLEDYEVEVDDYDDEEENQQPV